MKRDLLVQERALAARAFATPQQQDTKPASIASGFPEPAELAGIDGDGRVLVRLADSFAPVAARVASSLEWTAMHAALASQADVLVVFARGDRRQPIVVAVVHDRVLPPPAQTATIPLAHECTHARSEVTSEMVSDGRKLMLSAHDEISLRCGEASISLRSDGRVLVRGTRIETDAEGVNRIKGASVRIN